MTTASTKQHDFIAGLAASKDIAPEAAKALFDAASNEGFTKAQASEVIESLMGEADRAIPEGVHVAVAGPWEGRRLRVVRSRAGRLYSTTEGGDFLNGKGLYSLSAETVVDKSVQSGAPSSELVEGGIYVIDGRMIKVVRSQRGSLYGKQFNEGTGKWEYAPSLLGGIREEHRMSAEQAAAFGHEHNQCVFCSRSLSDERSRTVGYGSTCADNHNLPWGVTEAA